MTHFPQHLSGIYCMTTRLGLYMGNHEMQQMYRAIVLFREL